MQLQQGALVPGIFLGSVLLKHVTFFFQIPSHKEGPRSVK